MVERYGPLFQLRLGSWNTVFLADYDLIKKAFHSPDFANRPDMFFFEYFSRGGHGLLASNGAIWQEHRRFALRHLRDLGMGRSSMETHIRREVLDMIETFKKTVGQPVDFNNNLNIAITNIVWALVAGKIQLNCLFEWLIDRFMFQESECLMMIQFSSVTSKL